MDNPTGAIIGPMIFYKNKRMKLEWVNNLAVDSECEMTEKCSIKTNSFIK